MDEVFEVVHDSAAVAKGARESDGYVFGCHDHDFCDGFRASESIVEHDCFANEFFQLCLGKQFAVHQLRVLDGYYASVEAQFRYSELVFDFA